MVNEIGAMMPARTRLIITVLDVFGGESPTRVEDVIVGGGQTASVAFPMG